MINLAAEFDLAVANLIPAHLRHLAGASVSFETVCRAGYVGVERIATTGRIYMPSPFPPGTAGREFTHSAN